MQLAFFLLSDPIAKSFFAVIFDLNGDHRLIDGHMMPMGEVSYATIPVGGLFRSSFVPTDPEQ
jgi:hypothetical protein